MRHRHLWTSVQRRWYYALFGSARHVPRQFACTSRCRAAFRTIARRRTSRTGQASAYRIHGSDELAARRPAARGRSSLPAGGIACAPTGGPEARGRGDGIMRAGFKRYRRARRVLMLFLALGSGAVLASGAAGRGQATSTRTSTTTVPVRPGGGHCGEHDDAPACSSTRRRTSAGCLAEAARGGPRRRPRRSSPPGVMPMLAAVARARLRPRRRSSPSPRKRPPS